MLTETQLFESKVKGLYELKQDLLKTSKKDNKENERLVMMKICLMDKVFWVNIKINVKEVGEVLQSMWSKVHSYGGEIKLIEVSKIGEEAKEERNCEICMQKMNYELIKEGNIQWDVWSCKCGFKKKEINDLISSMIYYQEEEDNNGN